MRLANEIERLDGSWCELCGRDKINEMADKEIKDLLSVLWSVTT